MSEPKYKYVRIQGKELAKNTMYAKGVFSMCWQLIQNDVMDAEDADLFREIDSWFAEHLPYPEPCKRRETVVCWFKTENSEEMLVIPGALSTEEFKNALKDLKSGEIESKTL